MNRGHLFGYAAYVLNILSLLCVGRSFGPLFFTPVLLSVFTLGYCMSPIGRYRATIIGTGCLALVGSVLVEVLDLVPRSYSFENWQMTILPHAVKLTQTPTLVALTVGSVLHDPRAGADDGAAAGCDPGRGEEVGVADVAPQASAAGRGA